MSTTRRKMLDVAWKTGVSVLAVEAAWTSYEALRPLAEARAGGEFDVGVASRFEEKTATWIRQASLYVTRVKGDLFALSQSCPHLGCRVPFCEASGRFECPCHGSKYDLAGEWLEGPSPHGMNRHPIEVKDGQVTVDTRVLEKGPPLGTQRYLTPHRGGSCGPEEG